jgi:hypothetical protein
MFKNQLIALLCLCALSLFAQERQPLNGKVTSDFDDLDGIYVINKTSDATVVTTRGGYFTINAQPCDTLVFSAIQFTATAIRVEEQGFGDSMLFVPLEKFNRELDELVIIDYSYINSESLGLVPEGQKRYTPAERRVATASSGRMNPLGLDPIFNAFSGRTKMLKNAAEIEKKENLMEKIGYLYTEDDIIAKLKVPADYVRGFIYYAVENKRFVKAMDEKDNGMAKFMLSAMAEKYVRLLTTGE